MKESEYIQKRDQLWTLYLQKKKDLWSWFVSEREKINKEFLAHEL